MVIFAFEIENEAFHFSLNKNICETYKQISLNLVIGNCNLKSLFTYAPYEELNNIYGCVLGSVNLRICDNWWESNLYIYLKMRWAYEDISCTNTKIIDQFSILVYYN